MYNFFKTLWFFQDLIKLISISFNILLQLIYFSILDLWELSSIFIIIRIPEVLFTLT